LGRFHLTFFCLLIRLPLQAPPDSCRSDLRVSRSMSNSRINKARCQLVGLMTAAIEIPMLRPVIEARIRAPQPKFFGRRSII
jgi:hypothetical protein